MLLALVATLFLSGASAGNGPQVVDPVQTFSSDVLILGAGSAGLAAAKALADKNVSYIIIEGAGAIGGRLKSQSFSGIMAELGPVYLFGDNTTIEKWRDGYNLTGQYVDYENVIVRTSENTQPDDAADAAWTRLENAQDEVKKLYQMIRDKKIMDMSIRSALTQGKWFPMDAIDQVIEVYDYDFEFATVPELISTRGFLDVDEIQAKPFMTTDSRGLQDMLSRFTAQFMDVKDIMLNEVVQNVTQNSSHTTVTTESGKTFTGNYAIVTFSIGVLNSGSVVFEPALPQWKRDTLYRVNMAYYTQIYVKFPSKFWGDEEYILHASPRRGYYPIIVNLEAPGFYAAGTNILLVIAFGEEALRVERAEKNTIKEEIAAVFKGMYGSSTPEPDDILIGKWADNPFARGSFLSRDVGDYNAIFQEKLASKVGRLYFAGEAYPALLDGYFTGAMMSGKEQGEALVECWKMKKCTEFNPNPPKPPPPKQTCAASYSKASLVTIFTIGSMIKFV